MKTIRKAMVSNLLGRLRHPIVMFTRLAKFASKHGILADRGFARDAPKYPNFNRHVTPCFLTKRPQFMFNELKKDMGVCTLRYTSEAIFSHVFDEESLKDVVPYHYLRTLDDSWDWGHAMANFMLPLRNPKYWNDYISQEA
jgi:hypothetical protein